MERKSKSVDATNNLFTRQLRTSKLLVEGNANAEKQFKSCNVLMKKHITSSTYEEALKWKHEDQPYVRLSEYKKEL